MDPEFDERISGYLDGELDATERAAFERELESNAELRRALSSIKDVRQVTESMRLSRFSDDSWDDYWGETYNRLERNIGWIFLSLGAAILVGAGLVTFFRETILLSSEPLWKRGALVLLCLGGGFMIVSVIRERLFRWRTDPYRRIKR